MKKVLIGITVGAGAGIIDVVSMILQRLSWDANISAFSMWVVKGFLISTTDLKLRGIAKGLLLSFFDLVSRRGPDWMEKTFQFAAD